MAQSKEKRHEVDGENRKLNNGWTDTYVHIKNAEDNPMYLMCYEVSLMNKEYNVQRQFFCLSSVKDIIFLSLAADRHGR